jgi:hypothetical protein
MTDVKNSFNAQLFCKTYSRDINRFLRLLSSVEEFNKDGLPFIVSVPQAEVILFQNVVGRNRCHFIEDEDVLRLIPGLAPRSLDKLHGGLIQQIIKAEFWRFADRECYICVDADSFFIRDFFISDFISSVGVPFSVMHECKDFLQLSTNLGYRKVPQDFREDSRIFKALFSRHGPDYDFGPTPVVWSRKVWAKLACQFLEPRNWNIIDAIKQYPAELRWYGEALLLYRPIPIEPKEPLFRVYHTEWQYDYFFKAGESVSKLKDNYLGVVMQSNWDKDLDYGTSQKSLTSRSFKNFRKLFAWPR